MGVPLDRNSTFLQGPALGPGRIREALHNGASNLVTESGLDLGSATWWKDTGDAPVFELVGEAGVVAVAQAAAQRLDSGARLLSLGGDHSVSHPLIEAHADRHEGLSVLHVDAHPDLYDQFFGDRHRHSCPFARVMETGKVKRLVQVGIRALTPHQREQADRFAVEIVEMKDWQPGWTPEFDGPVYLTVDLDGLDPAFAPGVSHHEPGGLSTRDVLTLIQGFRGQLVGADIVELNPHRDLVGMTAAVAAKLVREISGRLFTDLP